MTSWNPWRELRERPHIRLHMEKLPEGCGDALYARWDDGSAVIVLSPDLDRRERNDGLAHELIHDERRGGARHPGMPATWQARVAIDELQVRRETAARLVPVDELAAFCDRMADLGEGVGPTEVMEEFDCTRRVAEDALDNLTRHERGQR